MINLSSVSNQKVIPSYFYIRIKLCISIRRITPTIFSALTLEQIHQISSNRIIIITRINPRTLQLFWLDLYKRIRIKLASIIYPSANIYFSVSVYSSHDTSYSSMAIRMIYLRGIRRCNDSVASRGDVTTFYDPMLSHLQSAKPLTYQLLTRAFLHICRTLQSEFT